LPAEWRARWADEAARYGDRALPETFDDPPNAGLPFDADQRDAEARSLVTAELARQLSVPRLMKEAVDRGWWSPVGPPLGAVSGAAVNGTTIGRLEILDVVDRETLDRLTLAPRLVANLDTGLLRDLLASPALSITMAVDGASAVGLVASALDDPAAPESPRSILAIGVAPAARRQGLATRMLAAHVEAFGRAGMPWAATVTLAERDPVEPLDRALRSAIAARIFERAGFAPEAPDRSLRALDSGALRFIRG
jgi:ribosomal protein S18 acetylase RimI-like enzyme